jgi:hypothetical protein
MSNQNCVVCLKNETSLRCHSCHDFTCKNCSFIIDENRFPFLQLLPAELAHQIFCQNCFNNSISDEIEKYLEILNRARDVNVFDKKQSTETRLIRRIEKPIKVSDCEDREETLLRLAFITAQLGFDTLVDVDISYEKVGDRSYKKFIWHGTATPVNPNIRK